jgi:hypothetical protein
MRRQIRVNGELPSATWDVDHRHRDAEENENGPAADEAIPQSISWDELFARCLRTGRLLSRRASG